MAEDQLSAIKIYCEESSVFDKQLRDSLNSPEKSYENCWAYIMEKAKQHLGSKSGHVMPNVVFGWAIHYFIESNETIESEVGKIKTSKTTYETTTIASKKVQIKKEKNIKKPEDENKASFERISIFDFMENDSNESDDDDYNEEDE